MRSFAAREKSTRLRRVTILHEGRRPREHGAGELGAREIGSMVLGSRAWAQGRRIPSASLGAGLRPYRTPIAYPIQPAFAGTPPLRGEGRAGHA